jgi:hypothetical protein
LYHLLACERAADNFGGEKLGRLGCRFLGHGSPDSRPTDGGISGWVRLILAISMVVVKHLGRRQPSGDTR